MNNEENALETAEILLDEEQMSAIWQGLQEAGQGLVRPWRSVRREMYGEWINESDEPTLRQLAEGYHSSCEAYEQVVCNGISPWTGEVMPNNPLETELISRHTREVRRGIMILAWEKGISEEQMDDAIKRYCK